MRISGWAIDGFGIFHDYSVRGLEDGLTVIYGPNEAGKTTLLAFIRGVLFGFPDGRSREPRYLPLRGGRHGGKLFLSTPDGETVVGREPGRRDVAVVLPDRQGSDDDLHRLLGRADAHLFRSVFAFSLAELQRFDTLSAEAVRERIFSAGIAGAGASARGAIEELKDQADDFIRPMSELSQKLAEIQRQLDENRQRAAGYGALLDREESGRTDKTRLDKQIAMLEHEKKNLEKLGELWSAWSQKVAAEGLLRDLPPIDSFPVDAESRLALVVEGVRHAREKLDELILEQQAGETERASMQMDDRLAELSLEIDDLQTHVTLHLDRLQKLPVLRTELRLAQTSLDEQLRELGPGWDEPQLQAFDRSIPAHEEIRDWRERLRQGADDVQQAGLASERVVTTRVDAQAQVEKAAGRLRGPEPTPLPELELHERSVRSLRAALADVRDLEARAEHEENLVNDRLQQIKEVEADMPWPWPRLLLGAIALLALASLAGWIATRQGALTGVAVLALAALSVGTYQRRRAARLGRIVRARREAVETARSHLSGRRDTIEDLNGRVAEESSRVGLPARPTAHLIEQAADVLSTQRQERVAWDQASATLEEAKEKLTKAKEDEDTSNQALDSARVRLDEVDRAWTAKKVEMQIPRQLGPDGVFQFFQTIKDGRALMSRVRGLQGAVAAMESEVERWEDRASKALATSGQSGGALVGALHELARRCQSDRETRQQAARLDQTNTERALKIHHAATVLECAEAERDSLYKEAEAIDEGDFRTKLAIFKQRSELLQSVETGERQLTISLGEGPEAEAMRRELATGNLSVWQDRIVRIDHELPRMGEDRDKALLDAEQAASERGAVEKSANVGGLELERQGLLNELGKTVRDWRLLTVARHLIGKTLTEFVLHRQPEVLGQASLIFKAVTGDRYERILQAQDGKDVLVLDRNGGIHGTNELSGGTAEQLYLCIRLALAAQFRKTGANLPMLMDDVLVNFDKERSSAIAKALVEFAAGRQVLLFTCHPETRETFLIADGTTKVIEVKPEEPIALTDKIEAITEEPLFAEEGDEIVPGRRVLAHTGDVEPRVLEALGDDSLQVGEIADEIGLDKATVRAALYALRDQGKVRMEGHRGGARWERVREGKAVGDASVGGPRNG